MPLVGIAKMAAQGPVLAAKSAVDYRELETRRWIGRCSGDRMPFEWTINPYRGCEFACRYCYARYTHEFLELSPGEDFETQIFAKKWSKSAFASELRRIPAGEAIGLGTATDPYQPAERRFGLTRRILEVMAADYGRRIFLTTKSDLVARDTDLLVELNRRNSVIVHMTITTMDREQARILEPKAPRPDLRLAAVEKLARAGVPVGVTASPVMPGINDSSRSLDEVARAAADAGARHFGAGVLFLKPCSYPVFLQMLQTDFPELATQYQETYRDRAFLSGDYPEMIRRRVEQLGARYGLMRREQEAFIPYTPQMPLFAA